MKNTQGALWFAQHPGKNYWIRVTNRMSGSEPCPLLLMLREQRKALGGPLQCPKCLLLEGCFFPLAFPASPFSISCGTNVRIILTRKSLNHALKSVCTWEGKTPNIRYMHQYETSLIDRNLWINSLPGVSAQVHAQHTHLTYCLLSKSI